ncbi:hypothetical protein [Maribellus mangrovi]|uniref:hypothetical protein n=1 Tax=Maribellus mangrovi TaxID=3133146 RepID=UPI0030EC0B92
MAKTFILHDESLNNHGFWMMTSGADLSQFKKNPIMLWNHNRTWRGNEDEVLPIGHWENIRIEGTKILADAVFDEDDFSQKIEKKVEKGTLRMASMGAIVIEESVDKKYIKPGQRYATALKWKAKEASVVDIGSNNNALALYDDSEKLIELSEGGNTIPLKAIETQNNIEMKDLAKVLKLKDNPTEQDYINAVQPMIDEVVTLKADLKKEQDEKKVLQDKLDAIELADKEAKEKEAKALIATAIKDGRLDDDENHTAEAFYLRNFEADFEGTKAMLEKLPKKANLKDQFANDGEESAWEKRQREIAEKNK